MTQLTHPSGPSPSFFVGQRIRIYVRVLQDNEETDPTEVTIMNRDPSGNEASQVYNNGAGNVQRVRVGVFYYDLDLDEEGDWFLRSKTTGIVGTWEQRVIVYESYFTTP